jgi:hypothetical protein
MKTKVSITNTINQIKKNNQVLEMLDQLQTIIETMAPTWSINKPPADMLVYKYKDKSGNKVNQFDFWDNLHYFVDINQDFLIKESKKAYESIKKQNK